MHVPGLRRLRTSVRRLRSRFVKGALILGYHSISDDAKDPFGLSVTPSHFREQLEVLRQYATILSLQALVRFVREGVLPGRAIALTFDDGYADNLQAVQMLKAYGDIPATIFVVSGSLGEVVWWDRLASLLLPQQRLPSRLKIEMPERREIWDLPGEGGAQSPKIVATYLFRKLASLDEPDRLAALNSLENLSALEPTRAQRRVMTEEELRQLAREESVEIGAHTETHPNLASLPTSAQRAEITRSKERLSKTIGRPVVSFAYPHGSHSVQTRRIVREAGYACACASETNVTWAKTDRYRLPRLWIEDWDGDTFYRKLRGWLSG